MTQKQVVGLVVGVALAVLAFVFVFRQYTSDMGSSGNSSATSQKKMSGGKEKVMVAPVPDTIDGVTADIEAESALDLSALDEEETASLEGVDEDSDSVNNLGTSYDENSL